MKEDPTDPTSNVTIHTMGKNRVQRDRDETGKRKCMYKGCFYFSHDASHFCCAACQADAYDAEKLMGE